MKLFKKLLPTAIAASTIVAATTTLAGCSCSLCKMSWSFVKDGNWNIYEDDLPLIESTSPVDNTSATKLYYDHIKQDAKRFASDVMYNVDTLMKTLHNDKIPEKYDVTVAVNDISFPKESGLISLSFRFDLYTKLAGQEETHSYISVNNMKYMFQYIKESPKPSKWQNLPYKFNEGAQEIGFLKNDNTWTIEAYFKFETDIPQCHFDHTNFAIDDSTLVENFRTALQTLVNITTDCVYSMQNVKHTEG